MSEIGLRRDGAINVLHVSRATVCESSPIPPTPFSRLSFASKRDNYYRTHHATGMRTRRKLTATARPVILCGVRSPFDSAVVNFTRSPHVPRQLPERPLYSYPRGWREKLDNGELGKRAQTVGSFNVAELTTFSIKITHTHSARCQPNDDALISKLQP